MHPSSVLKMDTKCCSRTLTLIYKLYGIITKQTVVSARTKNMFMMVMMTHTQAKPFHSATVAVLMAQHQVQFSKTL